MAISCYTTIVLYDYIISHDYIRARHSDQDVPEPAPAAAAPVDDDTGSNGGDGRKAMALGRFTLGYLGLGKIIYKSMGISGS